MQAILPFFNVAFQPFSYRGNYGNSGPTCTRMKKGRIISVRWRKPLIKNTEPKSLVIPTRTKE